MVDDEWLLSGRAGKVRGTLPAAFFKKSGKRVLTKRGQHAPLQKKHSNHSETHKICIHLHVKANWNI